MWNHDSQVLTLPPYLQVYNWNMSLYRSINFHPYHAKWAVPRCSSICWDFGLYKTKNGLGAAVLDLHVIMSLLYISAVRHFNLCVKYTTIHHNIIGLEPPSSRKQTNKQTKLNLKSAHLLVWPLIVVGQFCPYSGYRTRITVLERD